MIKRVNLALRKTQVVKHWDTWSCDTNAYKTAAFIKWLNNRYTS